MPHGKKEDMFFPSRFANNASGLKQGVEKVNNKPGHAKKGGGKETIN